MISDKCRLCHSDNEYAFSHTVLNKYIVNFFVCNKCQLLQSEKPYWLDEAYKLPITLTDTGLLKRNIKISKITAVLIYYLFDKEGKYIDYGGGYGIFTRMMRDIGFDFYNFDKHAENIFARGFEAKQEQIYTAATVYEVFEHLDNPLDTIMDILSYLKNKNIIFSTQLYGNKIPAPEDWWYYAFSTGQHISFYSLNLEFE